MDDLSRIETEASRLLDSFSAYRQRYAMEAFPLDLRSLVMNHLGVALEPQPDPRDGKNRRLLGALMLSGGSPRIVYRLQPGSAGRERFTIAHEIGHYILHSEGEPDYFCTEDDMELRGVVVQAHRRREWEANLFAGALLIPREELVDRNSEWAGDPERLVDFFGVSREALYWRMVLVGLAPTWSPPESKLFEFRGVRVLHFSDAHVGAEKLGRWSQSVRQERRGDIFRAIKHTVDAALEYDVDVVLFAGDAFQDRAPTNEDQRELARALWPVIAAEKHLVLVVGNHDRPAGAVGTHSLWTYGEFANWLALDNVHVADTPSICHLETQRGPLDVAVLPYVPPAVIAAESGASPHQAAVQWAETELARLASQRREGVPSLLGGHLTVIGAAVGEERHLMLSASRDLAVPLALLTRHGWDYVGLGHIHRAQATGSVVYAGSLERVDFGEEGQAKGFVVADLIRGKTTWSFCTLPDTRVFKTVDVSVVKVADPTETILEAINRADLRSALVRLRVELYRSQVKQVQVRRINEALEAAGALGWDRPQYEFSEPPVASSKEVEVVAASIDPSRPLDALRIYLSLRADVRGDIETLMALAQEIENHPDLEAKLAKRMLKGG